LISRTAKILAIAAAVLGVSATQAEAQVLFGGQLSVTNLGTDEAQVGETLGIGGRLGYALAVSPSTAVVFEAVGDVYFPPCRTRECDLKGLQFNVLGARYYNEKTRVYAGIGFTWQDYAIEDDGSGFFADDTAVGGNAIIGISWVPSPAFQPFLQGRFSSLNGLRTQAAADVGFRVIPGASPYRN